MSNHHGVKTNRLRLDAYIGRNSKHKMYVSQPQNWKTSSGSGRYAWVQISSLLRSQPNEVMFSTTITIGSKMNFSIDCEALNTRNKFATYIQTLENATHGNFSEARLCKLEVCSALYGAGNPDISGIGV
jgi:hypothetical protein